MAIFIVATSCAESKEYEEGFSEEPFAVNPIKIKADMAANSISRAYQEEGTVESGTFTLSYPDTNNEYQLGNVKFGVEGTTPSIGLITLPGDPDNAELIWSKIGSGSFPTFYLDNVPLEKSDSSDPTTVTFSDSYNPFVAEVFNNIDGTNDLLWGSKAENRNVNFLNFELHHNMARLQVIVTVNNTNSAKPIDLTGATVEITNLVLEPVSYNRLDGTLSLGEEPEYNSLTLVGSGGPYWYSTLRETVDPDPSETDDSSDSNEDTDSSEPSENSENIVTYTTQDFVLPPQNLQEDSNRPRLNITLPDGTIYSGVIPYAMIVIDSTYPSPGYPMTLTLLKEHILTIRTLITEEPPELSFMPVYVVDWVDKGEFSLDGHQAGIYSAAEFYKLIEYYKSDENTRNYQLTRYGTLRDDTWNFVMWNTLFLDYGQIYNQMTDGPSFTFSFSGYGVYVTNEGVTKAVSPDQLYQIVTGTLAWQNIPES